MRFVGKRRRRRPRRRFFAGKPSKYAVRRRRPRQSVKVFFLGISAHWVKRHACALDETSRFRATTRRQNTPYNAHFGGCQKFAFRSVLPISHKSRAFAGTLRSPQMAPTKRQRSAFCGKEEAPALKAKVFYRKTEQMRRAPTTSAALGKMFFFSTRSRIG